MVRDLVLLEPNLNPRICGSSKLPHESALYILHNALSVCKVYSPFSVFLQKANHTSNSWALKP